MTDGKRTPLPREGEVLVLQASAGTGKTWQVADMVLRAVVADASLTVDRFLLVTYTNAAVAELRDRVRGRLEDARRVLAGDDPPPGDATLAELAAERDASREPRRRVETALARFDELLVSTIHGFCQRMLDAHATRAGLVPPREIVASADEVVARACAELRGAVARWSDPDRYEALVELLDWNGTANLGGAAWKTARAALVGPSPPKFEVIAPEDSDTRVLSPFDAVDAAVTACRLHAARLVAVKDRLQSVLERPKGSLCSPRRKKETTEAVVGALRILLDCATKLHQYASADGPIDETILRTSVDLYQAHDENREARRQHWQVDQDEDVGALATLYDAFDRDISLVRQRLVRTLVEPLRPRVRAELERTGVLTYDEMLARLDDALEEPHGGALGDAIRAQFHFAIVDEFQDTDPAQWSILRKLFAHAQTRLVLVGDPKQSIYGFRGADIHTYESAIQDEIAGVTRTVHELSTNHRSDPVLLEALEHLFGPGSGTFMTDAFDFVHVEARPGRIPFGMRNAPEVPAGETTRPRRPLEIRHGEATADACAEEIAALLAAGTEIADDDGHWRGLSPGDVAVLVYTHEQARRIHRALAARGIPSVRAATESVFESDAATWLLRLVRACAGGRRELHLFLDTPLGGFEPEDLSIFTGEADPADERAAAAYRRLDEAANAVDGCMVLSVHRMDAILDIDTTNRMARVQPGVINAELKRAVAEFGLFYPPDPASYEMSSIGGNVATNAGGLCCVKYGVTRDYVMGLEVVLASGEVMRTGRRTIKSTTGFDLTGLFVGSEGLLGIVTEVTVKLVPLPPPPATAVAYFGELPPAGSAIAQVFREGHEPSLMEILDQASLRQVEAVYRMGLDIDAACLLLVQTAGEGAASSIEAIAEICQANGAGFVYHVTDPQEGDMLVEVRRRVWPAFEKLGKPLLPEDVAVPRDRLPELLAGIVEVGRRHDVELATIGHAGDGNMHPFFILDPANPEEVARAKAAFVEILDIALALGGTIAAEHGIGTLKRAYLENELDPIQLAIQRQIKQTLDPHNRLNPGKAI